MPAYDFEPALPETIDRPWFDYPVRVQPHHTDYGGVVWHGTYLTWLEAARVEYLRQQGLDFADLVAAGCDLPVVELAIRYHRAVKMGESVVVKARLEPVEGVRLTWEYSIESPDGEICYATAEVLLVPIDREKGKILRQFPPSLAKILAA